MPDVDAVPPSPGTPTTTPEGRGRQRLTAAVEVVLVSGFPTQLAVGGLLLAAGLQPWNPGGALSMRYLVGVLLLDTVLIGAIVLAALQAHGERPADVFLGARPKGREAWFGLALVPLVVASTGGLLALLRATWPALHNVQTNPFEALIHTPGDAAVLGVAAVLGGAVKEELQRAFILRRFDQHLGGARTGLVIYSLVFGAGHAVQGLDVGVMTALLGLAWGAVFLWRRSVVAPMVSHAGFNAAQIVQFALAAR